MSLPISIEIATPDPDAAPTTFTELVALLRELITAEVTGTYLPYVTGSATPDVGDQDKVWHRTDAGGRPLGTFVYYGGAWRRQYVGNPDQIVIYSGDPTVDFAGTAGLGTVGGDWDGWALCNGSNGTVDLSDKFVVGSHMTDLTIGYAGDVHSTTVSGSTTAIGGAKDITLDASNTYRPAVDAFKVRTYIADGHTADAGGDLYGIGTTTDVVVADAGNLTPPAIPTLPPYIARGFAQFVGFA